MNTRNLLAVGLAIVLGCAVAIVVKTSHPADKRAGAKMEPVNRPAPRAGSPWGPGRESPARAENDRQTADQSSAQAASEAPARSTEPASRARRPAPEMGPAVQQSAGPAPSNAQSATPPPRPPAGLQKQNAAEAEEPIIPYPVAREALAWVGADAEAEEVWVQAINDPTLSRKQREDLIEDLNEVGIDPKNLTADDVPLILSRLAIIEDLADDAMDEVNAAAFAEAYKDLSNMLVRAMRQ